MISKATGEDAETTTNPEPNTPPLDKRRVLLYALTPVALLALLTIGMRMASDAARKETLQAEAREQAELQKSRAGRPALQRAVLPAPAMRKADKASQKSIETTVRGQLFALRDGDYQKALSFAIPEFRTHTTPNQFGQMIHAGYSPMLDTNNVAVKQALVQDGPDHMARAYVETVVRIGNGNSVYYTYTLIRNNDGWGVQGVMAHPGPNTRPGIDDSPRQPREAPQIGPPGKHTP